MLPTSIVPQKRPDVKDSAAFCVHSMQNASAFPQSLALDINEIVGVCEEKANCSYTVATKSYIIAPNGDASQRYRAEYTTLVPDNDYAPKFVLERNMYGFYFVDLATGLIDSRKHTAFWRLISSRNAPVVTASPIIKSQIIHYSATDFSYTLLHDGFSSVVKLTTAPDGTKLEWPVSPAQEAHIINIMNVQVTPNSVAPIVTLVHRHGGVLVQVAEGWQAESNSRPGTFHATAHDGSTCTCKGFNGRYSKC